MNGTKAAATSPAPGSFRSRELAVLALFGLAALAILVLVPFGARSGPLDAAAGSASVFSLAFCLRRAWTGPQDSRAGWVAIAAALGFQALSHLVGLWYLAHCPALPPFPNLANWLQILVLPALALGLALWPIGPRAAGERRRCLMDSLVFGAALFFLFWQLGLREAVFAPGTSLATALASLASFFAIAFASAYWVYLVLPSRTLPAGPVAWIGLLLLGGTLVNLLQMLLVLQGGFAPGSWLDALVIPVLAAAGLGALDARPVQAGETCDAAAQPGTPALDFLPYLPLTGALLLVLEQALFARARLDWQAMLLVSGVSGLLLARQFLALRDLSSFSSELEHKVRERTQALEDAQELLLRTERMNTLASLGAGLAHDFKNLLGIVKNYASLIELEADKGPNPKHLDAIHRAVDQAAGLTHRLMAYGRGDGAEELRFDLGVRLEGLMVLLRATQPQAITLRFDPPAARFFLWGRPGELDQIIVNLVLNARDAIRGSGVIRVSLGSSTLEDGSPAVYLRVEDTGQGMAPEVVARLGEPFFTTKAPDQGTGLGLASVKALVNKLNGVLQIESAPGHGTTMTLRFPA